MVLDSIYRVLEGWSVKREKKDGLLMYASISEVFSLFLFYHFLSFLFYYSLVFLPILSMGSSPLLRATFPLFI